MQFKTQTLEPLGMLFSAISLALAHGNRLWHQQRLAAQTLTGHGHFQPLISNALMGRMHIHHHQPLNVLGEDIDTLELRDGVAQRRNITLRLRERSRCRRSGHRREKLAIRALSFSCGQSGLRTRTLIASPRRTPDRRTGCRLQQTGR